MSTSVFNTAPSSVTGLFALWGAALSAALTACGITATTDTGQVNWGGTITSPTTTNTYPYYEIRQFTDTLQTGAGSNPIYLKIEYGSGYNAAANPGLRITIGSGSNGSGTLTGITSVTTQCAGSTSSSTLYPSYISSDGSRLQIILWPANNGACVFSISRTVNDVGAYTNDGVNLLFFSSGTPHGAQFISAPGGVGSYPSTGLITPCTALPSATLTVNALSNNYGLNMGVFPIYPFAGFTYNFDYAVLCCNYNDFNSNANGTINTFSINGVNHNYIYTNSVNASGINGNSSIFGLFVRFE
jgi:hypothetical protein